MPDGQFVAIGEDWSCDECGDEILSGMQAYIFQAAPRAGQCHCIRCAVNPDSEGSSERLVYWRACRGYDHKYETADIERLIP